MCGYVLDSVWISFVGVDDAKSTDVKVIYNLLGGF